MGVFNETFLGSKKPRIIVIDCPLPPPTPNIRLEHEISIDGGITFLDADTIALAPITLAPHNAEYRLITRLGMIRLKSKFFMPA